MFENDTILLILTAMCMFIVRRLQDSRINLDIVTILAHCFVSIGRVLEISVHFSFITLVFALLVSRVVCGSCQRLLAPWTTWPNAALLKNQWQHRA